MRMDKPNILLYFTDQQRTDSIGCYGRKFDVTPVLDRLAAEGVLFERAYTPQPVCGPCRAVFQTGLYATQVGCHINDVRLPKDVKTLANYMEEAGYENAYVGKWHLAGQGDGVNGQFDVRGYFESIGYPYPEDYQMPETEEFLDRGVPRELRGGYNGYWRVSDVLEMTSHGYDGYVFDENDQKLEFKGYRTDCITDYALEFLDGYDGKKPFFLTVSHLEPHQQNDRGVFEGPKGSKEKYADYDIPAEVKALGGGDAVKEYPDYLGCCNSLDTNLGRVVDKLKEKGLYENTVIVFVSDHGCHFKTRNKDAHMIGFDDYKRSCHSSVLNVPLIFHGPGFEGGKRMKEVVSTVSLPKTLLSIAGVDVGDAMQGEDLQEVINGAAGSRENYAFAQISESRVGRCIHTPKYLYSVYAPGKNPIGYAGSDVYEDDFLYDLEKDPLELNNLINDPDYREVRDELAGKLKEAMVIAGEKEPEILYAGGMIVD